MGIEKAYYIPRAKEQAGYGNRKKHIIYPSPRSRRGMEIEKTHNIPRAKEQAGYGNRKNT